MPDKKRSLKPTIIAGGISAAIFLLALFLVLNRQYVADQVSVWAFRPSAQIVNLNNRLELTGKGEFFFFATQPKIANAADFNKDCPRLETGNPILGCYASPGRIYIYDITNEALDGIEEVTAAHEMLHAAWDRLDDQEKKKVASLLRIEYQKHVDDALAERMAYYERNEPGQFENELHSILATEVRNLEPELETYYSRYFKDRGVILNFFEKYDKVFKDLKTKADNLFNQLVVLGKSIEERTKQYNADTATLTADIQSFNTRAQNGSFASISQFNRERAALVTRSNQLDADRVEISGDIDTYNTLYTEYQSLASQIEVLNSSLDSINELQPTPSL